MVHALLHQAARCFPLQWKNNRLPVVLSLQPALFFVAGDTVFLFFREKKYGVAKSNLWYAERMARTIGAEYTPLCTNLHDVFPCSGKEPLAGCA